MLLKKFSVESMTYSTENLNEIKKMLKRNCEKIKFPAGDIVINIENYSEKK